MALAEATSDPAPTTLLAQLLVEQQSSAAHRFSQWHDQQSLASDGDNRLAHREPRATAARYHELIPLQRPKPGEQYAFDVDLDACSGCKACVSACNKLNGLEPDETWRSVGQLVGGTSAAPVLQHVTTACHHCLEPACLAGCPVRAYEKDPVTGIVLHLDDQCIGCQYCIFQCPYDVPQYVPSRGIVRKCDMCHDRLAADEAPACVQSCPNQAIRIVCVDPQAVVDACETGVFLPGAPDPSVTLPTTNFRTARAFPRNLRAADYFAVRRQHSHLPLVLMLVLTQMSVGAFIAGSILDSRSAGPALEQAGAKLSHAIASLLIGLCGMLAAVGHLGRPLYAFRAWIGLRTSWMSREIVAFGLFPGFAALYAVACYAAPNTLASTLGAAACLAGLVGVGCSAMIYIDTQRPTWRAGITWPRFLLTTALLGMAGGALIKVATAWATTGDLAEAMREQLHTLSCGIVALTLLKLAHELIALVHVWDRSYTVERRAALLLTGELWPAFVNRLLLGLVGGVLLPGILALEPAVRGAAGFGFPFWAATVPLGVLLLTAGELIERHLFFATAIAPRMPGGMP